MFCEVYISARNTVSVISFCGVRKAVVSLFPFCVTRTNAVRIWAVEIYGLWDAPAFVTSTSTGWESEWISLRFNSWFFFQHKQANSGTLQLYSEWKAVRFQERANDFYVLQSFQISYGARLATYLTPRLFLGIQRPRRDSDHLHQSVT